jgi:hypothetical protein
VKSTSFRPSLVPLLVEWRKEPSTYFKLWKLDPKDLDHETRSIETEPTDDESDSSDVESETGGAVSEHESSTGVASVSVQVDVAAEFQEKVSETRSLLSQKQDDSLRWIFLALFFRDVVMLCIRRKTRTGLFPRGNHLRPIIQAACETLAGSCDEKFIEDVGKWSKEGQLFHLVGEVLGDGSLLLLSDHITK